jgi:hypothetical protein
VQDVPVQPAVLMLVCRVYLFSLLYTLTWQFAQFVSLLQALALFGLATIGLLDKDKASATIFKFCVSSTKNSSCLKTMDQISIKTPNSKCRFYWCLIEFRDWR